MVVFICPFLLLLFGESFCLYPCLAVIQLLETSFRICELSHIFPKIKLESVLVALKQRTLMSKTRFEGLFYESAFQKCTLLCSFHNVTKHFT